MGDADRDLARFRSSEREFVEQLLADAQEFLRRRFQMDICEVEDVAQDAVVTAFTKIESFRGQSSLRTWVFGIARKLALGRLRLARRAKEVAPVDFDLPYSEEEAVLSELAVEEFLGSLRSDDRTILAMAADGHTHVEIGAVLGITGDAVASRLSKRLRELTASWKRSMEG